MLTSARSPLETTVVFRPKTRQVIDPLPFEHETDLPAAVAAAPADALTEVTLAAGKFTVHWKPVGCAPLFDTNETGTITVAPGVPADEPTLNVTLWAARLGPNKTIATETLISRTGK
jgi:hypothetical protein